MSTRDSEPELVMLARSVDLAQGLSVRRAIPQARRRMVGPFVFVDQMGPAEFPAEREIAVLAHPHIGLSTVTYLFEGEGLHRDSLGTSQAILPGEVNWMTAGRGIAHSERLRSGPSGRTFGVQLWVALPQHLEECAPAFEHYGADATATLDEGGVTTRLIAGSLFGARSKVRVSSPLFYAEVLLKAGSNLRLPAEYDERAAFVVEGSVRLGEGVLRAGEIGFFRRGAEILLDAEGPCRLLLLGGEPLDGPRFISWNFVSSSKERLLQAASDWRHQRFDRVPGETAYLPLPEDGEGPVNYP